MLATPGSALSSDVVLTTAERENKGRRSSFRFKVQPQAIEFEYLIRGARQ